MNPPAETAAAGASREAMTSEREVLAFLDGALGSVDLFLDVGANMGGYTETAARIMRQARLVAVEANPGLARALAEMAPVWTRGTGNDVTVLHAAVSDRRGTIRFYDGPQTTTGGLWPTAADDSGIEVPAVLLADLVDGAGRCLIKIDVEGAEWRVIAGSPNLLQRPDTAFLIELHGFGDRDLRKYPLDLLHVFRRAGYSVRRIGPLHHFERRDGRVGGYLGVMPIILAKYIYRKYLPALEPVVVAIKKRGFLGRL